MSTRQKIINKALKGVYAHHDIGNARMVMYDRSLHVLDPRIKIVQDVLVTLNIRQLNLNNQNDSEISLYCRSAAEGKHHMFQERAL